MPLRSNGGARPGAGRKPRAEKYESEIAAAERRVADRLPRILDDLFRLAHGGWWEESEERAPARLIEIGQGETRTLAYPEKDPDELVVVKRTRRRAAPDRAALVYLADRILGKPTARVEADVTHSTSDELRAIYEAAVAKIYEARDKDDG